MKKIYKFKLTAHQKQSVAMPKNAKILHADEQHGEICIWAELDPDDKDYRARMFEVFGTGHEMNEEPETKRVHIGTVKLQGGALIFHVYERIS